ncbi:zinc protease [Vairimorpha necatrix]|uniref:Zinc protease n=1 Tax=Vairimorpha necatrix TaxID=6039 RepID=A0AAX4J9T3_9MICR
MSSHILLSDIKFIKSNIENKFSQDFSYIFDSSYDVPKTNVFLLLKYQDYFINLLDYTRYFKTKEEHFFLSYDSLLSSYMIELNVTLTEYGIEIHISGISTKIVEICSLFIEFLFKNKDADRSSLVLFKIKNNLIREKFAQSYKRLFQKLKSLFIEDYSMSEDMLNDISKIENSSNDTNSNLEDKIINNIVNSDNFRCEIYVIGNILLEEAECIKNIVNSKSNISFNTKNGLIACEEFVDSYDVSNNACGLFFPTNKTTDLKNKVISSFIVNSVSEIFFDQLRTNEEFGYVVSANTYKILDQEFIYFVVQSERDVKDIKDRIFKFIEFTKKYLKEMKEEEFLNRKEAIRDHFSESHKNLSSYSNFLYTKGICGLNGLKYKEEIVQYIENMKLNEVIDSKMLEKCIVISTKRKK